MARFTRGKSFTATEEVTNAKLHQLVDDASINAQAITDLTAMADEIAAGDQIPLVDVSVESIRKVNAGQFISKGADNKFNCQGLNIKNLAAPLAANDAASKSYVDEASIAAGNLPNVTPENNEQVLKVVGGAFALVKENLINQVHLTDNSVVAGKIAAGAVVAGKLGAASVGTPELQLNCVTSENLATSLTISGQFSAGSLVAGTLVGNGSGITNLSGNGAGNRTISTANPNGGAEGDIWYQVAS